jgi:hypothetical protein
MLWYDTTNNILKMRTELDDDWIDIGTLDQSTNEFFVSNGVLDEDDFATDSATRPPSQQSTKAYVDGATDGTGWAFAAAQASTSGTAFDFGSIPADVNEIQVTLIKCSLSGNDDILIQLETSGGVVTTGYDSGCRNDGTTATTSTAGFIVAVNNNNHNLSVTYSLYRTSAGWHGAVSGWSPSLLRNVGGAGESDVTSTVTSIRVTRTGVSTFDAGEIIVGWRK